MTKMWHKSSRLIATATRLPIFLAWNGSYKTCLVLALLRNKFPRRVISYFDDVNWPPFVTVALFWKVTQKIVFYVDNLQTLDALNTHIHQVIVALSITVFRQLIENYLKGIQSCKMSYGGHLNDNGKVQAIY